MRLTTCEGRKTCLPGKTNDGESLHPLANFAKFAGLPVRPRHSETVSRYMIYIYCTGAYEADRLERERPAGGVVWEKFRRGLPARQPHGKVKGHCARFFRTYVPKGQSIVQMAADVMETGHVGAVNVAHAGRKM